MRILVTGIAGFIGSHVAERLVSRGDEVVGIDDFNPFYPRPIKERNLSELRGRAHIVEGDVLDASLLDRVLGSQRFDVVLHLAALPGVRPSLAAPARYQRVNVEGSCVIGEAVVRHGAGKLVFASSSSVYGGNEKVPFAETDRTDRPLSPYAASKRAAELVLSSLSHTHGLSAVGLRYFTVYGPRQRPEMAVHAFCRAISRGEPVTLFGDGTSSRDYTYVDDAVAGTLAAVDRPAVGFRVYNIGGERRTVLRELVDLLGRALGREPCIEWAPDVRGDVKHTCASLELARAELGFEPAVSIEEGLRRFVAWYRARATEGGAA